MTNMIELYTRFVINRHVIYDNRMAGLPQPWTKDPILASRKFTNVFRVLDPGSQFVLTDLYTEDEEDFLARCVLYRMTNLPSAWEVLRDEMGRYPDLIDILDGREVVKILQGHRDAGGQVFSGAYIIMPEPGTTGDKIEGAVRVTQRFISSWMPAFFQARSQEERFNALRSAPGIGKFLAMQILTDWGYCQTVNLENEFIIAGPGARRGALIVNPDVPPENTIRMATKVFKDGIVRVGGMSPSLMDVQNTFCEFSKYHRFAVGGKPYRNSPYRPAHPGPQPLPVLPVWWQR